jgi:hypothetical protein
MCCKNKSLLVTEEEKIRILGLYGILAEEIIVDENGVKIHTKQVFEDSKYYKLKNSFSLKYTKTIYMTNYRRNLLIFSIYH